MSEQVNVELVEHILKITFNRADKMNSITQSMYEALFEALKQADDNPDVRVVYLNAEGDNFCAGNDMSVFMKAMKDESGAAVQQAMAPPKAVLLQLARMKKPLVIAVKGMAVGIGANMVLHCDLAFADTSTRFVLPFINLGLSPEGGCSHVLPHLVGHAKAAELLMLGEPFSANTAAELGIINAVCEPDELEQRAWSSARKLAAKPPEALRLMKSMLRQKPQQPLEPVILSELEILGQRFGTEEAKEALSAFAEKRAPDFSRFS
ncbi:MAG: enoyl-CoA hydratase [Halopseudomonas sp.]